MMKYKLKGVVVSYSTFHKVKLCRKFRVWGGDLIEYYKRIGGFTHNDYIEGMKELLKEMCDPYGKHIMNLLINEGIIFDEFAVYKDEVVIRVKREVYRFPKSGIKLKN